MTHSLPGPIVALLLCLASCATDGAPARETLDADKWLSAKAGLYQRLALQYLRAGDHLQAKKLLEQAVQFDASDVRSLDLLTRLAYSDGDLELARSMAAHLLEIEPDSITALCTLGAIDEARRDPASAERSYRHAVEVAGDDPAPLLTLHRFYVDQDRLADAVRVRNELAARFPHRIETFLEEGSNHASKGRWSEAAAAYRCALDAEPTSVDAASRLALAGLIGQTPNAVLEIGRRLSPRSRIGSPALTIAMAIAHVEAREYDAALGELELLDADVRDNPRVRVLRGELLRRTGRIAEAKTELEAAIGAEPDLARAHSALARIHLVEGSRHAAVRSLTTAIGLVPTNAADHALLASCLASEDPDAARRHLQIARGRPGAERLVAEADRLFPDLHTPPAGGNDR